MSAAMLNEFQCLLVVLCISLCKLLWNYLLNLTFFLHCNTEICTLIDRIEQVVSLLLRNFLPIGKCICPNVGQNWSDRIRKKREGIGGCWQLEMASTLSHYRHTSTLSANRTKKGQTHQNLIKFEGGN